MRVLHIGAGNLYGGLETMLVTMAQYRQFCPELEPVFTVCFEGRLGKELRSAGVPVYHLGEARFSRPWTVWLTRWRLNRLLKKERFNVAIVHSCWTHSLYAKVLQKHRIPIVFWFHEPSKGTHWLERRAMKYPPKKVIACSQFTQSHTQHFFPQVESTVVYPMVPPPKRSNRSQEAIRKDCETSLGQIVILMVARLEEMKGHRVLLEALAQIRDDPQWVCWIAGGPQRESEEKYLRELKVLQGRHHLEGRIRWLGQRLDIADLLSAANIYCQPNTQPDSFGITFVEALHAGLPIVTTAIGGAVEIVTPECGTLLPINDAKSLAQELARRMTSAQTDDRISEVRSNRAKELTDPIRGIQQLSGVLQKVV